MSLTGLVMYQYNSILGALSVSGHKELLQISRFWGKSHLGTLRKCTRCMMAYLFSWQEHMPCQVVRIGDRDKMAVALVHQDVK